MVFSDTTLLPDFLHKKCVEKTKDNWKISPSVKLELNWFSEQYLKISESQKNVLFVLSHKLKDFSKPIFRYIIRF